MFQLSFNQKVGFGFAFIIILILSSGLSSLWNLNDINESTSRVNQTAVPVVKESNQVQIQLLKLAKLSGLAFNAEDADSIRVYKRKFDQGVKDFGGLYESLEELAKDDADMKALVIGIKSNYDFYRFAVTEMFEAKSATLLANEQMHNEAGTLFDMADALGGSLVDLQYFMADGKDAENMELVAGFANQADANALSILKTVEEVQRTTDLNALSTMDDFKFALQDSKLWYDKGADVFKTFGDVTLLDTVEQSYAELSAHFDKTPSIIDYKMTELEQIELARAKLREADAAVSQSVEGLDELLKSADVQFSFLQGEVLGSLDFGFKSSIVLLIVLVLLAAQNFNSMRSAIQKKMADLAKLNKIGGTLAGAQSQNTALEEVLQSMHEKMGVSAGSVYLTNEKQELVVKAHFPPKAISADVEPTSFELGEGIIGKAAKSKQIIFVPNTEKDKSYVQGEQEVAPKALLCVPLIDKDMLVGVINLSGDVKQVSFADSDYEYVSSVAQSLVTTIKNIRMREVIEEHNRTLEAKVEERTAALHQKNQDIANMMANMHQGLFTVSEGGVVHKEYAAYLEQIFETDRIAGRNVNDLLFANTTLGSDARDQNITAVDAIVGEDEMMFEFNSHCLVNEMTIGFDDGREKVLELDWDPIVNDDVIERLMITVRDVTEIRALELAAQGQKRELELIGEVLAIDAAKFAEFLRSSKQFMAACQQAIKNNAGKSADVIAELFRNMHTVKGNARTYGLSYLTDVVHEVESTYDALRNDDSREWKQNELLEELREAQEILAEYDTIYHDKLGRDGVAAQGVNLDSERVASWLDSIKRLTEKSMDNDVQEVVSEAYSMLLSIESKTLSEVISEPLSSLASMAEQLDKPAPEVRVKDAELFIDGRVHSMMNNIFMHVLRNAMDHGIEGATERAEKGKNENGLISINTQVNKQNAEFIVSDDGRGIAIAKIRSLAVDKGIIEQDAALSAQDIANLVFTSGFSTAEEVSNLSGRGVGMDAVRQFLESEGGSIELRLTGGNDGDDFRAFETVITLPERFYSQALSFAKTA
ncbi:MAG: GAF domain-containing protein [Oleiphilaceae bacterium]|nr:GAF domain-containing protein [Oleiphilaceae bacterium]